MAARKRRTAAFRLEASKSQTAVKCLPSNSRSIRHNFFYFVVIEFVVCVHNLTVVRHGAAVVYNHAAVGRKAEGVADAFVVTFEENRGGDDDAVLKNAAPDFAVVAIFDVGIELLDRIFVIHNLSPFLL